MISQEILRYLDGMNATQDVREWVAKRCDNQVQEQVEHIIDYLCSYKRPKRLDRATFEHMYKNAEKWSLALQKKGSDYKETEEDIETVLTFKKGFKIVKLLSKRAFEREGKLMRHCVGGYFEKNDDIYSLRDKDNQPHATLSKSSEQIKGKGNGSINPKYVEYVVEFLEYLKIDVRDSEMKLLGYYNIEKIKHKLYAKTPLFRDKYLFETEEIKGKDNTLLCDLDIWDIKPLISNDKINYDLNMFLTGLNVDYSNLASSGKSSKLASSGDSSTLASSGNYSNLASSGNYSNLASSGYYSTLASSGHDSKLELKGNNSVGANIGISGKIKGIKGTWITLAEYDEEFICICVKSAQIDGVKLKENVWYKLKGAEFVEVEE